MQELQEDVVVVAGVPGRGHRWRPCHLLALVVLAAFALLLLITFLTVYYVKKSSVTCSGCSNNTGQHTSRPNIVFILVDDLGFNEVSWHNPKVLTPNLEQLASQGLKLDNHYVQPVCTPTRAALMTGYYPIHTGRQHRTIRPFHPVGLYTNFTFLPEFLGRLGYISHAVGKWHLGFCNESYLPTRRGFKSFYGFYNGAQDYFDHSRSGGYDFWFDDKPDTSANGTYSTDLFARRVEEILLNHVENDPSTPLFLYLSLQSVHGPYQVKEDYLKLYPQEKDNKQKTRLGMISTMDDSVGKVVDALKSNNMYENTIIIFTSDVTNGGPVGQSLSNFPLRGGKGTLFEGGTKTAAFIYAPSERLLSSRQGQIHLGLFHVTDWLPTLVSAASTEDDELGDLSGMDGVDQWESLRTGGPSPRVEMLYNIDQNSQPVEYESVAVRVGEWKLIRDIERRPKDKTEKNTRVPNLVPWRLFNLTDDPTESRDLYQDHPEVVARLMERLDFYRDSAIPPHVKDSDWAGLPKDGLFHTGWCKAEPR